MSANVTHRCLYHWYGQVFFAKPSTHQQINRSPHHANNFHYYANSLCSQNVTIMLKKFHYYAQKFSPDHSVFTLNKIQLLVNESQTPSHPTWPCLSCGVDCHAYSSQEIRNPNFKNVPNSDVLIYLFLILWHISGNFSYYYAGVMLDAHESLSCSKLCRHNVDNPNHLP